mgnify:CR=1 FL=1
MTKISPLGKEKDNVTTFEVRVSIDNPGKELKANMTANAEVVLEELRRAQKAQALQTRDLGFLPEAERQRRAAGLPYTRLAIILGGVALATAACLLVFRSERVKRFFGL